MRLLITPFEIGYVASHNVIKTESSISDLPSKYSNIMTAIGFWDDFWTGFQMPFKTIGDFADKTVCVVSRGVLGGNLCKILEKIALNTVVDFAKGFIKRSKATPYNISIFAGTN